MKKTMFLLSILVIAAMIAAPVGAAVVAGHSLSGGSNAAITYGGTFSSAGWTPTAQRDALIWHASGLSQGAMEFSLTGIGSTNENSLFTIYDANFPNADSQSNYTIGSGVDGWRNVPNKLHVKTVNSALRGYVETNNVNPAAGTSTSNAGTTFNATGSVLSWDPTATYRFRVEWYSSGGVNNGAYMKLYRDSTLLTVDGLSTWPTAGMAMQPFTAINGNFSIRLGHQSRDGSTAPIGATYSNFIAFNDPNEVPEPSSMIALGTLGLGAFGFIRRRRA